MRFEDLRHPEDELAAVETHESTTIPEEGGEIVDRFAVQAQQERDAKQLSETRSELGSIEVPKIELTYEREDVTEAAERVQNGLREKGEQIKLTPDQMQELQRVVDKYITLSEDNTLQEGNGYDDMRYFIGREARNNVQKLEARNKIVEISSTVIEAALPPAAIASGFVITPSFIQAVLLWGGTFYGIANAISLGTRLFMSDETRITALVNYFANRSKDKQLEKSEWLETREDNTLDLFPSYATFLQNSDEFFAILEKLKKTESFKQLNELAEDLRSVLASTDKKTGENARKEFLKKKTQVIGSSLSEASLGFSDQDIQMLLGEAVIIRAEKKCK